MEWANRCSALVQASQYMVNHLKSQVLFNSRKLLRITKELSLIFGPLGALHVFVSSQHLNQLQEAIPTKISFFVQLMLTKTVLKFYPG